LLHASEDHPEELALMLPEGIPSATIELVVREGAAKDVILEVAEELGVDVIAMASRGHDSLLDIVRGSLTERVMRSAKCPVLTIPIKK